MNIINTNIKSDLKRTKVGLIPADWSYVEVGNVFTFLRGSSFSRSKLNYDYQEESIFNIHYGDIHSTYTKPILNCKDSDKIPVLNSDISISSNIDCLMDGDVLIADASEDYEGVGKAIELENIAGRKIIAGLHTFALRDHSGLTVEGFRAYIFKNPNISLALKKIATGSKVYGISKSNLDKFKIVLPTLPEQQKIV